MLLDLCSRPIENSENCDPLLFRLLRRLGGDVDTLCGGGRGGVSGYSRFLPWSSGKPTGDHGLDLELGTWNLWRLTVFPSHLPTAE